MAAPANTGRLISPDEMRRQNSVLRRLIEHVRTYSPEVYQDSGRHEADDIEPPISHRRPFIEHGQLE